MKQIQIIGNIGREPQLVTRTNGKDYLTFSVAVTIPNGTEWYGVCAPCLEKIRPYLTKGRMVFIQGTPRFSIYKDTVDITIFADAVQLCGGGARDDAATASAPQAVKGAPDNQSATADPASSAVPGPQLPQVPPFDPKEFTVF